MVKGIQCLNNSFKRRLGIHLKYVVILNFTNNSAKFYFEQKSTREKPEVADTTGITTETTLVKSNQSRCLVNFGKAQSNH